jgi:AraC family transcriptional regulator, transcriptional activator of pobA
MKPAEIPLIKSSEINNFYLGDSQQRPFRAGYNARFHITRLEDVRTLVKFPTVPHRKTVHDFVFLSKGKDIRTKGLDTYTCEQNSFFFLSAYQIGSDTFLSADAEGFYCRFDNAIFSDSLVQPNLSDQFSFLQFDAKPLAYVNTQSVEWINFLLNRLLTIYVENPEPRFHLLTAYLLSLFTEIKENLIIENGSSQTAASKLTREYKNALAKHIYKKQTVHDYSKLLNVSSNHLNKCVKATLGETAHDLLSESLLLEAKVLLKQTNLSISEIAFKVCNQDPSDFTRFFKSKTNLTPKEYRTMD